MKRNIIIFSGILILLIAAIACEKPDTGYISEHMFYNNSIYIVERGQTTYSAPLVANGSTTPLYVDLVKVKDSVGNDVTEEFKKPRTINVYADKITYKDSTLELLAAKIKDSLVQPFQINPIGGRMEFTPSTKDLPGGSYTMDIEASNIAGSVFIEDVVNVILSEYEGVDYELAYKRVTRPDYTDLYETSNSYIDVKVEYEEGTQEDSKLIYKFIDKNGVAFDPAAGEIKRRSIEYPFLTDWIPWYPLTLEDEQFNVQFPGYEGLRFPYWDTMKLGTTEFFDSNMRLDFQVPKGLINEFDDILHILVSVNFFKPGTYTVTTQFNEFTKKTP